jgi:protein-disulfide isomerase
MPPMINDLTPSTEDKNNNEVITFTLRRPTVWISIFIPLAFIFGIGIGYLAWGRGLGGQPVQQAAQPQAQAGEAYQAQTTPQRYEIPISENDPARGPEDAPITIIEFSDFECPYCQRYNQEVVDRIWEEYGDQIRYIFKDFPLTNIHPNSLSAALAAQCANEQDAFWEYHKLLFSMQEGLSNEAYQTYAESLGLDMDAFNQCVEEKRYEEDILTDLDEASTLGVRSTPTFLINGLPVIGAQPYEVFAQVIEQELAADK